MEENTQLPKEVVERILKARDALVVGDRDEAYHQLYGIASPKFDKYYPWGEMEKQVGHIRLNEQDIINSKEVTAYATKLHQAETYNGLLKNEIQHLNTVIEKLKATATGWRPLLEEVLKLDGLDVAHISEELIEKIKSFLYGE